MWKKVICRNPSLGLATKARACEGVGQEWGLRVTFHALKSMGVWASVREWTPTLPSELPLWELESRWTLESSKSDCRGQNPLDWKKIYIIEKLLERRCPKSACMTHLGNQNTSYGQEKGWKSNWQFDFRPLKVGNCPDFLVCR
jgi:hypothetical protein